MLNRHDGKIVLHAPNAARLRLSSPVLRVAQVCAMTVQALLTIFTVLFFLTLWLHSPSHILWNIVLGTMIFSVVLASKVVSYIKRERRVR